ncbi:MAG TPA: hypothetical protein VN903_15920 [Polyangia bacterium]|jgi:hypothetical protein|nr:hypothetical protein [Polyangia bacterium]
MTRKPLAIARAMRTATAIFLGMAAFPGCVGEIGARPDGTSAPPGSAGTTGTTETAGTMGTGTTGTAGTAGTAGTTSTPVATDLPCDVSAVLSNRCWSCHGATPAAGAPPLTSVAAFMATSRINPSQTVGAVAVTRMQSTTMPMPPPPTTLAPAADVATISNWVTAGYPAGASCGAPPTTPVCTSMKTWTLGNRGAPEMNPGRACIDCHARGEGPRFTIAGTVYPTVNEPDLCYGAASSSGAQIVITGADGQTLTLSPNAAGNFYSAVAVALPFSAKVVSAAGTRAMMATQTSGDCNSCHTQMGANSAPGRIMLP